MTSKVKGTEKAQYIQSLSETNRASASVSILGCQLNMLMLKIDATTLQGKKNAVMKVKTNADCATAI
jgi:hypothetical protein